MKFLKHTSGQLGFIKSKFGKKKYNFPKWQLIAAAFFSASVFLAAGQAQALKYNALLAGQDIPQVAASAAELTANGNSDLTPEGGNPNPSAFDPLTTGEALAPDATTPALKQQSEPALNLTDSPTAEAGQSRAGAVGNISQPDADNNAAPADSSGQTDANSNNLLKMPQNLGINSSQNDLTALPEPPPTTEAAHNTAATPARDLAFNFPKLLPKISPPPPAINSAISGLAAPLITLWVSGPQYSLYSPDTLNRKTTEILAAFAFLAGLTGILLASRKIQPPASLK
ncbi:MAG: hypothetical protein M1383_04060 [Patescibacteria group bacterium]|nr:hypothetical protein [Patescibacteria group bacterium]